MQSKQWNKQRYEVKVKQMNAPATQALFGGAEALMRFIALHDQDAKVRRIAAGRLREATSLAEVYAREENADIRRLLIDKIEDKALLGQAAREDPDAGVRHAAAQKLRQAPGENLRKETSPLPVAPEDLLVERSDPRMHLPGHELPSQAERLRAFTAQRKERQSAFRQGALRPMPPALAEEAKRYQRWNKQDLAKKEKKLARIPGAELAGIALYDTEPAIRRLAAEALADPAALRLLYLHDADPLVRAIAFQKCADADLARITLEEEPDAEIRALAVGKLTDEKQLRKLMKTEPSPLVREAIVERFAPDNNTVLREIFREDSDPAVRMAAYQRMENPYKYRNVAGALRAPTLLARLACVQGIQWQDDVEEVALRADHPQVREAALGRLTDLPGLHRVALYAGDSVLRAAALQRVEDACVLAQAACLDDEEANRAAAAAKLPDAALLERLREAQEQARQALQGEEATRCRRILEMPDFKAKAAEAPPETYLAQIQEAAALRQVCLPLYLEAVRTLHKEADLALLARTHPEARIREEALRQASDPALLWETLRENRFFGMRRIALSKLAPDPEAVRLALGDADPFLRREAVSYLTDQRDLVGLLADESILVQLAAVARIDDVAMLTYILRGEKGGSAEIEMPKLAPGSQVEDPAVLLHISRNMQNADLYDAIDERLVALLPQHLAGLEAPAATPAGTETAPPSPSLSSAAPPPWENVYVFISSTFVDMHAERDFLVKRVFPRLAQWCEERRLRLIDIDLRWGVSEADANENKRVLKVCLERIDACRPFFLCFLGQRRGWLPATTDIGEDTYAQFPQLKERDYLGHTSVTEMEIIHALLDPLHADASDNPVHAAAAHAFFFLRDPSYLSRMENPLVQTLYTNAQDPDPAGQDAALRYWREEALPATGKPVYPYHTEWLPDARTPELSLPLACPSSAPAGSPAWQRSFDHWAAAWRRAGVTVSPAGEIDAPEQRALAEAYNAARTQGRLGHFTSAGKPLEDLLLASLQEAITQRFGPRLSLPETSLASELDQQAQFLQVVGDGFIRRAGDLAPFEEYLRSPDRVPLVVTGSAGAGKTSLLAHFILRQGKALGEAPPHYRFIGGSDGTVTLERLLRSLLEEWQAAGKLSAEIPMEFPQLLAAFPSLLAEAAGGGPLLLVVDALEQLEPGPYNLSWIPAQLPEQVKLVISLRMEETDPLPLPAGVRHIRVTPFASLTDRRQIVTAYLDTYFKELDESHVDSLISSEGAENPLFLRTVLSELRVFGAHDNLAEVIGQRFGHTPVEAFGALLRRLEEDPAEDGLSPAVLIPFLFGCLAHSRYGLSVPELADLLCAEGLAPGAQSAGDALHAVFRQLRPFLAKRDGRVDFLYASFRDAALSRYQGTQPPAREAAVWHALLAAYFAGKPAQDPRRLMELAYQYARAGMQEPLRALLLSYAYLEDRLASASIHALLDDFSYLSEEMAARGEDAARLLGHCLRQASPVLARWPDQLPTQLTGRMLSLRQPALQALLREIQSLRAERHTPWLRPRFRCMTPPDSGLQRTLPVVDEPHWTVTQVCPRKNPEELVVSVGERATMEVEHLLLLHTRTGIAQRYGQVQTPYTMFVLRPQDWLLVTSRGNLQIIDLASNEKLLSLAADHRMISSAVLLDRLLVTSGIEKTLFFWDLTEQKLVSKLGSYEELVRRLILTRDSRSLYVYAAGWYHWDLPTRTQTGPLSGQEGKLLSVLLGGEDRFLLTGEEGGLVSLTDRATGGTLWQGRAQTPPHHLLLSADGTLVYAGDGRALEVWNTREDRYLGAFQDRAGLLYTAVLEEDQGRLLSGSSDSAVRIWDMLPPPVAVRPEQLPKLRELWDIALAGDQRTALTMSADRNGDHRQMDVLDLQSGEILLSQETRKSSYIWDAAAYARLSPGFARAPLQEALDAVEEAPERSQSHDSRLLSAGMGGLDFWRVEAGTLRLVDAETREVVAQWKPAAADHALRLRAASWTVPGTAPRYAVSPQNEYVAARESDFLIQVWDVRRAVLVARVLIEDGPVALALTREGKELLVGDHLGQVYFLALENAPQKEEVRG